MASHEFIKPHRRLPSDGSWWVRAGDRWYLLAVIASHYLWRQR